MTEPTTPKPAASRGRKPADHKQKDVAAELDRAAERDALLADMPPLTPPSELRFRDRARVKEILALAVGNGAIPEPEGEGEEATVELDIDITTPEGRAQLEAIYDVCGKIDEFAAAIAVDRVAYDDWSRTKEEEHFFAILARYQEAVGESTGS